MTEDRPTVERLLEDTLASGELEQQLRAEYRRWDHLLDFDEFSNDTLARAWEYREQFQGSSTGAFLVWLRRIGRTVAIGVHRQRQRTAGLLARFASLFSWPFGGDSGEAVQTRDLVEWLLAGLTERERSVMTWKYFEGLSIDAIAQRLQTTREGAYQLHYRALNKLRARTQKMATDR
jgi:RNA polymerase sigma factor (sigma-70 family)